jgi:CRISPR/Cas system endoribonuclease Cas6 (RAMP superfamily)
VSEQRFQHIRVGKFTFRLRALSDLHLPAYKGATLRGGFGHALKQVTCALKRQECSQCLLRDRCVYLYLFETPPPADTEMMRLYPAAPHPFIIEPPMTDARVVPQGDTLEFGLVLVGKALDHLPYFVYAFICLGEKGLGRGKGEFLLEQVLAESADGPVAIYDQARGSLQHSGAFPTWETIEKRCGELAGNDHLSLDFITPTRIKFEDRLVEQPEFHHLVRALLRRLSMLSYFHCEKKLDLNFRGILEAGQAIGRISSQLRWYDWERYSNRQHQRMNLGGFLGTVSYVGDFHEFLPLLAWGEVLHLGKAASFGLGRFRIQAFSPNM